METLDHGCKATMQRNNTESRAYPCKCLTFGCLATTGVSDLRLPNNDGIRPNTSQYQQIFFGKSTLHCCFVCFSEKVKQKTKQTPWPLSPLANYSDWATATCRRNLVPTFVDREVSRGQRGGSPTVVNLSFLDRSRYFSFK
jgi:hypothetical protein